ncbi:glutathione peroxidase [Thalassotalea sp. G2M2-11]|uniref:glutathione peroxidase n=1 Tax=Thalassotalea sp. G2M2-11 TaxID=2787627 RepID=UPI0019CF5E26|nr:glutathione peroxidase [Thalassotalea sp. G2M2-11]
MLENKEGQTVPNVKFTLRANDQWQVRTSEDIFTDKTVIVFALPGAFTPTCSSTHLPRYNELAQTFYQQGVDEIICLSVNDTFVMNAWAQDQHAEHISFLPDGNGEFSQAMGMLVDKAELGFGKRSWRYAMLVKNGVIEKMFIEPEVEGDPFEVSDADTMLAYINPEAAQTEKISMFTKPNCPYCQKAKTLLAEQGLAFVEIEVGQSVSLAALKAVTNADTVPQVFIDGQHIGGSEALASYFS